MKQDNEELLKAMKRFVKGVDGKGITSITISTPGRELVVIDKEAADNIKRNVDNELKRKEKP